MSLDSFITRFGGWTESYWFYDHTIELRYDPKQHVYLLVNGDQLEAQAGVTSTCHVLDKSDALIPWACKMMATKLLASCPPRTLPNGDIHHDGMPWLEFERLVIDAKSAHKERLNEAGLTGNIAHAWIERYIKRILAGDLCPEPAFPSDERAANCCVAALDWMRQHNVRWISTECKIYSRIYKYAGTMDGLCYVDSCQNPNCCPHAFTGRLSVADWKSSNHLYLEYMLQTAAYQHAYEEEYGVSIDDRWVIRLGKEDGEFEPWHMEHECMVEDFRGFLLALDITRCVERITGRIKAKEDRRRASEKADKQAARIEALKIRCKGADKYKGVRYPKCNGGNPCWSCLTKYAEKHPAEPETIMCESLPSATPTEATPALPSPTEMSSFTPETSCAPVPGL